MPKNKHKSKELSDCLPQLIDLIPDPISVIDTAGTIAAANRMVEELSGYEKELLIGKSFSKSSFISEADKKIFIKMQKED